MTQYMLSVHNDPDDNVMDDMTPEQMQEVFTTVDVVNTTLQEAGAWVFGGGPRAAHDGHHRPRPPGRHPAHYYDLYLLFRESLWTTKSTSSSDCGYIQYSHSWIFESIRGMCQPNT